jgi:hypothetical protein
MVYGTENVVKYTTYSIKKHVYEHSRNNKHHALICTTPLIYILAPTCFGSSLPSSGSFLDASELTLNTRTNRMGGISYNVWLRGLAT